MLPVHERQPGVVQVEKATRVRYWVIVFAATLAVVTYIDRVALSVANLTISKDLGLDSRQMGLAFMAFGVAYAAFEIPGGYLGDRLGPRSVLMRIVLWWSFFTAATGFTFNFISIATTQFLFGAGEAGCFPNLTKTFTTWLPSKERVRAQGIMWLSARWGGAFTPPLVVLVMSLVGWRHTFQIFGGLGVIWAVIFYRWYRNNPLDNPKLNEAERDLVRTASANARPHGDVPWARFFTSRQVWMICLQYFCLSYGWYFYITWLPTYLREERGQSPARAAFLAGLPLLFGGIGSLTTGLAPRRLPRRAIAFGGFAATAVLLVAVTRIESVVPAMLAMALASFASDLTMPISWDACVEIGGPYCATVASSMNMLGNLGGFVAPVIGGIILAHTHGNWNLVLEVMAALVFVAALCWLYIDPEAARRDREVLQAQAMSADQLTP